MDLLETVDRKEGTDDAIDGSVALSGMNGFLPIHYTTCDDYSRGLGTCRDHPEYVIQFQWKEGVFDGWILVADRKASVFVRICYWVGGQKTREIDLNQIEHNQIVDLNDEGDRWEGDVLDGQPFGFGTLFNADNVVVYAGFYALSQYVCYGTLYYGIGAINYEGEFYNGKRYGAGILYDRRGDMCYDGVWIDDAPPIASVAIDSVLRLHNHVEEVTVSNYCCNELSTLSFTRFDALRSLHVGNNCFRSVDRLWLEGLPRLADLLVGDRCFSEVSIDTERRKNPKRSFRVRQCPQLRSIRVGCYSFSDYASFCVESECRIAL